MRRKILKLYNYHLLLDRICAGVCKHNGYNIYYDINGITIPSKNNKIIIDKNNIFCVEKDGLILGCNGYEILQRITIDRTDKMGIPLDQVDYLFRIDGKALFIIKMGAIKAFEVLSGKELFAVKKTNILLKMEFRDGAWQDWEAYQEKHLLVKNCANVIGRDKMLEIKTYDGDHYRLFRGIIASVKTT